MVLTQKILFLAGVIIFNSFAPSWAEAETQPDRVSLLPRLADVTWERWGSADFRRFGFRIYRATLWVGNKTSLELEPPYALELEYAIPISRERLVTTSIDEIRRLSGQYETLHPRWTEELKRIYPNVKPGERIIGIHLAEGAVFYHGINIGEPLRLLGRIDDPSFARSFFGIWLDPKTSAPEIRSGLLKGKE